MTRNLVTGANGFVGQHLVAELLRRGEVVIGAVQELPAQLTTLTPAEGAKVQWVALELASQESVCEVVRSGDTDRIFHLAGLSSAAESLDDPLSPFRINAIGTLFLLDELTRRHRESGYAPTVLITGSAHVYGHAATRYRPLTEACPLEPTSPYAVSKAAQELLGLQFSRAHGIPVIVTRSFNHTGPGQRPSFVAPELARKVLAIRRAGGHGAVKIANPSVRRDFTDVRDVVRAYVGLAERAETGGVYNICSGRAYAVEELLFTLADLTGVEVEIEVDPQRQRPADVPEMVGSYERLAAVTDWAPEIEIRRSLRDLLAYESKLAEREWETR